MVRHGASNDPSARPCLKQACRHGACVHGDVGRGMRRYRNRQEAGVELASALSRYAARDAVVLGLPRGGIPVAFEVARALEAPLDVIVVRKLGLPGREELA